MFWQCFPKYIFLKYVWQSLKNLKLCALDTARDAHRTPLGASCRLASLYQEPISSAIPSDRPHHGMAWNGSWRNSNATKLCILSSHYKRSSIQQGRYDLFDFVWYVLAYICICMFCLVFVLQTLILARSAITLSQDAIGVEEGPINRSKFTCTQR